MRGVGARSKARQRRRFQRNSSARDRANPGRSPDEWGRHSPMLRWRLNDNLWWLVSISV
jgi:hypothetical protein